jgi:F-type H+-transporting ATPase subunit a
MATEIAAEAVHAAGEHGLTAAGYIIHHLGHFRSATQTSIIDMHILNYDTIFWSVVLGMVGCFVLWLGARRATAGVPTRFQAAVEVVIEMVDNQSKLIVHGDRSFVGPLALTIFVWIVLMNSMDFLPVDLFSQIFRLLGLHTAEGHELFHRAVPTADLNGTFGIGLVVLTLMFYYNIKVKGLGGFIHHLFCAPFGSNPLLWLPNLAMNIVEFAARTVSLSMRLYGNMFAGELVFLLIALLGATWIGLTTQSVLLAGLQVLAGSIWAIFHLLIVVLQAFIFMMLTLVYLGQAHDAH